MAPVTGLRSSRAGTPGVPLAGRYRLVSPIAAGAVGEVWRAADLVLARPVAVKLLRPEHAQHPETLARFRAEARHAGSLAHPGVAHVYDYRAGGDGHPPYLVMELVDGPSLAGLLDSGPLEPASAMDLVAQAAAGLHAAHSAGLVHRDIKPGNLLVGPGGQVKITDFGIAYAAGSAPLTRTGMLIGTPAYLAPERLAGGTAGPASDLYSLGVVAWECLAGAPPFTGIAVEVAMAHRDRPLPPLPDSIPGEVVVLVAELTAKDPARPAYCCRGRPTGRIVAGCPGSGHDHRPEQHASTARHAGRCAARDEARRCGGGCAGRYRDGRAARNAGRCAVSSLASGQAAIRWPQRAVRPAGHLGAGRSCGACPARHPAGQHARLGTSHSRPAIGPAVSCRVENGPHGRGQRGCFDRAAGQRGSSPAPSARPGGQRAMAARRPAARRDSAVGPAQRPGPCGQHSRRHRGVPAASQG